MPDFRKTFDARLPALNAAIDTMPGQLEQYLPGLTKPKLKRLFQRFSLLLGRLDKNGAKQPQYLWHGNQQLPTYLQTLIEQSISHMASGAATFVQNNMPQLVEVQDRLEKAVGTDADQLKNMASTVAADLGTSVQQSDEMLARLRIQVEHAAAEEGKITSFRKSAEEAQAAARDAAERAAEARRTVEQLLNPDGRNKSTLESLARRARERINEVGAAQNAMRSNLEQSTAQVHEIDTLKSKAEAAIKALRGIQSEAEQVLNMSSQAGLAASYKAEGRALEVKANFFTGILYFAAVATLVIAAFYVLPGLQQALAVAGQADVTQALIAALLRASVLAPLVYVIYFTTKRISALETLRMDYAEKAAASLAYSGYREQMTNDDDLLRQLKGSLLSKFHEHPERLLRSGSMSSSVRVKTPGFEAENTFNVPQEPDPKSTRSPVAPAKDEE